MARAFPSAHALAAAPVWQMALGPSAEGNYTFASTTRGTGAATCRAWPRPAALECQMQRAGSVTTPKKEMYPLPRSEFNSLRWALNVPNMKPWLLVCYISGVKGSISFDITNCSSVVRKLLKSVFHPKHWARFFHQLYIPPMVVTPQGTCRDVQDSSHVGGITNISGFRVFKCCRTD